MSWAAILVTDFLVVKKAMKIGPGYYEERQNIYINGILSASGH